MVRLSPPSRWDSRETSGSQTSAAAPRSPHPDRLPVALAAPTVLPGSFGLPGTRLSMATTLRVRFDLPAQRSTAQTSTTFCPAPNLQDGSRFAEMGAILSLVQEVRGETAPSGAQISTGRTWRCSQTVSEMFSLPALRTANSSFTLTSPIMYIA